MRRTIGVAIAAALLTAGPAAASDGLERAVLKEMNFARTNPAEYARTLAAHPPLPGESDADIEEAVRFLFRQKPLAALKPHEGLEAAAASHASAQGRTTLIGHTSPGGTTFSQRLQAAGVDAGLSAENISYGYDDARSVVRQLIVDSGVPNRGHRLNIFGGGYEAAGVSCHGHRRYGAMCVIDFAGALLAR